MLDYLQLDMRFYHEYLLYAKNLQEYIQGQAAGRAAAANKKKL